ncbi:minichromosome maintenance protein MCM [Halorarum salinum]|uniref:DNA helicase n=1 Tax=Halorarum salinum TaxID=2743089 RepID=A0A7D5LCL6_9EURY|nr:minichromosome maintenance protein MCM [Halobaculum salinum]QLG62809.1 minichromosome maintenance protein MCM [Halobaculum salinum]
MSTTTQAARDETEELIRFLRERYADEVARLAQRYPKEQTALEVDYTDLYAFDHDFAEDGRVTLLDQPDTVLRQLNEALRQYDLPADVTMSDARVRVHNLPADRTYYPGEFSPTDEAGTYRAITGEISRATDEYSKVVEAAFECERCATMTYIPQVDTGFQEPHECQGCERQGPFRVDHDQSEFIDAQQFRIQTPPEIASGAGTEIDVFVEDDLAGEVTVGDRVTVTGILHIEQQTKGREKTGKFEPYMDGVHIALEQTDHTSLDVAPEDRERIHELAGGEAGDPLDLGAASIAPKIYGYDQIKRMGILAMVGGSRVEYPSGDADRGEFHMLLLGDPGTAKSKLIERIEELGWRTVGMSGKGATIAGTTATAAQDDFGDGDWTLDAGAFVKANKGTVCIDELDDMPADVRAAMLEPMSKQTIHINKAGINTRLNTRTAVIAAGNPEHGRFNEYQPVQEQFDLGSTLLSRFDLIYVLKDKPEEERDSTLSGHILDSRDAGKCLQNGEDVADADAETVTPPVAPDILRKWIALAKQQPEPTFASEAVRNSIQESFTTMRGINGDDEDSPVPLTFRKLEGIVRIAEAAAKFEFSEEITERHAQIATEAVGESMRDFGMDQDGNFDADVQETGTSKTQRDRIRLVAETITELEETAENAEAERDDVVEALSDEFPEHKIRDTMATMQRNGEASEPSNGTIRYLGKV